MVMFLGDYAAHAIALAWGMLSATEVMVFVPVIEAADIWQYDECRYLHQTRWRLAPIILFGYMHGHWLVVVWVSGDAGRE